MTSRAGQNDAAQQCREGAGTPELASLAHSSPSETSLLLIDAPEPANCRCMGGQVLRVSFDGIAKGHEQGCASLYWAAWTRRPAGSLMHCMLWTPSASVERRSCNVGTMWQQYVSDCGASDAIPGVMVSVKLLLQRFSALMLVAAQQLPQGSHAG